MRYSPYPAENYALSHRNGYLNPLGESAEDEAIWNLAWLSIPHIDSYLNLAYEDFEAYRSLNVDFRFAVKIHIVEDLRSRPELRQMLTTLSPAEFLKVLTPKFYTSLHSYKHGGDDWLTTVRCRAEAAQARLDIEQLAAKAENVMIVDFKLRNGSLQRVEAEPKILANTQPVDAKPTAESPKPEREDKDENKRFIGNSDGTVTDTHTGLMWIRCALGQEWNGFNCIGKADERTWEAAIALDIIIAEHGFAEYSDWRLPDIYEMDSLIIPPQEDGRVFDDNAFPQTPPSIFWSCSSSPYDSLNAWGVDFEGGAAYNTGRDSECHIRLVRGHTFRAHNFPLVNSEKENNQDDALSDRQSINELAELSNIEIIKRLERLDTRFDDAVSRLETLAECNLQSQSLARTAIDLIKQHSEFISAERGELRPKPVAPPSLTRNNQAIDKPATDPCLPLLHQVIEWLTTQESIPLAELRIHLLPLDLLPSAVINDINERALDSIGELALVEEGDTVIVQREVLLQVIAA